MIQLYNTRTKQKQEFKPLVDSLVRLYCCGPTVYNFAHIGNLRAFIFDDLLRRVLEYNGYKVKMVMNITDIGHLSSDADEGEDKMVSAAKKEKTTVWDIAEKYIEYFLQDIKELNIKMPHILPRATEHIDEMIRLIEILEKKGFTYIAGGNVYFDTSKFKNYSKFANLQDDQSVSRVGIDKNKKNQRDFVLWFTKSKFQDQEMKWDSPWGTGYPGWHLECSAMSMKYLGLSEDLENAQTFDIHCGGVDHIPVHHTNEIAQTEAATGRRMANFWLHNEWLIIKDEKMSKSKGNFIRLQTIKDKGFRPLDFRYLVLNTHYRSKLMFSWQALKSSHNALQKIYRFLQSISDDTGEVNDFYKEKFLTAINDDINLPKGLGVVWDLIKDKSIKNQDKKQTLLDFDKVLGLNFKEFLFKDKSNVPEQIIKLAEQRYKARKEKNWELADKLRKQIEDKGFIIKDTKQGWEIEEKF